MKYLALWCPRLRNIFWKICKTLRPPFLHTKCTFPKSDLSNRKQLVAPRRVPFSYHRKKDDLEVDCYVLLFLKSILSDVLILVMWPKWVHKHLQGVTKNVFSWEKPFLDFINRKYLTVILKKTILINGTCKFCYRHRNFKMQKQSLEVFLKTSQNSQENTYARVYFLIKLKASDLQLY